ncbi:MAG TPA: HAD family hydrolase [Candidatus Melainabacteria bacterium]|nr:HAD family hydrolase [Candidatus Melainabacteria bacterium]
MYKLAIFDFDGTLVDSAPGIIDVMRQVVVEYELHEDILTKWRDLVGVPLGKQMEIIFPNHSEEFWLEVADRYRAIYDGKTIEICPLFPDLITMLNSLRDAGIKISIASSKRRPLIEVVLEHHKLSQYFELVVGATDITHHKPHPESVHHTVKKLGLQHADTVVIGDSIYDLEMARNAGVDAIGVTTGIHSKEILITADPLYIVDSLDEVGRIILNGRSQKLA